MTDSELERVIQLLARLPGLGPRSARRAVLQMIKKPETLMLPLAAALQQAAERISPCSLCGNFDTRDPCVICRDERRDRSMICLVEEVGDLWALERSGAYRGLYHVLGGTLSALAGRGPEDLGIDRLLDRIEGSKTGPQPIKEAILALSATVDGQTTAHYLAERLSPAGLAITRLAHGLPVGGELDYLDDGTLSAALRARRPA
jgi:recombination protein RecR